MKREDKTSTYHQTSAASGARAVGARQAVNQDAFPSTNSVLDELEHGVGEGED